MDAEVQALVREVVALGDAAQAPRLGAALARAHGDPAVRLRQLLRAANKACRISDVPTIRRGLTVHARTVPWRLAVVCLSTVFRHKATDRCSWEFGPSSDRDRWQSTLPPAARYVSTEQAKRDTVCLLACREVATGLVTVGVGIADVFAPSVREAWPALKPSAKNFWPELRRWARDFEAGDRVVFTVDQVRALTGKKVRA